MVHTEYCIDRETWPERVPRTLEFPHGERPLHEYVAVQADRQPNAPAYTFYGRTLTWGGMDEAVESVARTLRARGHQTGDVCGIHLQNCPQFVLAYYGALRAGLVVSPINPQVKQHALDHQLTDAGVDALVTQVDLLDILDDTDAAADLTDVFAVRYDAMTGDSSPIPTHGVVTDEGTIPDDETPFQTLLADDPPGVSLPDVALDDLALLQYTGGTTGLPKGCEHTHWNLLFAATTTHHIYQYRPDETHLGVMPIFHIAGKVLYVNAPAVTGHETVLLARYTPESLMAAVDAFGVTASWFSVPVAQQVIDHEDLDEYDLTSMSSVRQENYVASLGTNLTLAISEDWEALTGARLHELAYGLTETHTMDTSSVGEFRIEPEKGTFLGQPNWGTEIEIRHPETNEVLPPEEQGEIAVRTPSMMERYHDNPEATADVMDGEFMLTGDVGWLTEEGYLYFVGRRKDTIKVSGHTVSPREIESILENDDRIADAIVVGKPHETRGSVPEAYVVQADESLTEAEVIAAVDAQLAEFKIPKSVVFVDSLPRTDVGKIDRVTYRESLPEGYE